MATKYPGPEKTAEILDTAREVLLEKGWCQGKTIDRATGRHCLVGAISWATARAALREDGDAVCDIAGCRVYPMNAVIRQLGLSKPEHVPHWNDSPGRELFEVVEVLEMAAKKVRSGDLDPR